MSESTAMEWVKNNSPYKGSAFVMHLLLAHEMDQTGQNCYVAAREHLATAVHCTVEHIRIIEEHMIADGYLEVSRSSKYGYAAREYRLIMANTKTNAAL